MTDNPRIEALRRRVEKDPTSIAFAQLAEEYRRGGDYHQAITICRDGLARHPGYLSAQVTLGRALMEVQQFDEARRELKSVLSVAPDNLAAIRALADLHERVGDDELSTLHPGSTIGTKLPAPANGPANVGMQLPALSPPRADHATATKEDVDPALPALEQWLTAIAADRARSR